MERFEVVRGPAAPLPLANVDTDVIVRVERCTTLRRGGFGAYAFESLRMGPDGTPDPGFVLNRPPFDAARVLVARENFGCGSSREAAVWALQDFGIRCVVAPSFGAIFEGNCYECGVLPVRLPAAEVEALLGLLPASPMLEVDLAAQEIRPAAGPPIRFEVEPLRRAMLLEGRDAIEFTLARAEAIAAHRRRDAALRPWLAAGLRG